MLLIAGDSLAAGHIGIGFTRYLTIDAEQQIMLRGIDGDTMLGVTSRVLKYLGSGRISEAVDALIIECGGNDVLLPKVITSGGEEAQAAAKTLIRSDAPALEDPKEFGRQYALQLDRILARWEELGLQAGHVAIVLIPLLGEELDSQLNASRVSYNEEIRTLAHQRSLTVLDFALDAFLRSQPTEHSGFLLENPQDCLLDAQLIGGDPDAADRLSDQRGLLLTTDGIHLNSRGARLASRQCGEFLHRTGYSPS
jgi:lysophospholipase L1-like esterase